MSNESDHEAETESSGNSTDSAENAAEELLWEPPKRSKAERAPRTSWIVFGTATLLSLSFLAWGVISPEDRG